MHVPARRIDYCCKVVRRMKHSERFAPVAAVASALATMVCCLPLGIAGAAGALGLGVALARWRPWLIGLSIVMLAAGVWQLYRSGRTCRRRSRWSMVLLGLCAASVLGVMVFPPRIAAVMPAYLP